MVIAIVIFIFAAVVICRIIEEIPKAVTELKKKCPMCAERVMMEAKICKHCEYEFGELQT